MARRWIALVVLYAKTNVLRNRIIDDLDEAAAIGMLILDAYGTRLFQVLS